MTGLEAQARQAILQDLVESYKQDAVRLDEPAFKRAVLVEALRSGPSLMLIAFLISALVLLIFTLKSTQMMVGLVLGLVALLLAGEIGILYRACRDEGRQTQALTRLLQPQVTLNLAAIQDKRLKAGLYQALHTWAMIDHLARKMPAGAMHDRMAQSSREITRWLQANYSLAGRVDGWRLELARHPNGSKLQNTIQALEQKLQQSQDAVTGRQLQQRLAGCRQELQALQTLQDNISQAYEQLDNTLSALSTMHAQIILITGQRGQVQKMARLQAEIGEETGRLQDLIEVMGESRNG